MWSEELRKLLKEVGILVLARESTTCKNKRGF